MTGKKKERKDRRTLSAREFAAEIGVGVRTVRNYIRTRKIDGRALVKVGRQTRIRPQIAKWQLATRLAAPTSGRALTGGARLDANTDRLHVELKSELLRGLRLKANHLQNQADGRAGRYVRASEIDGLLKRAVTETFASLEAHMPGFVAALADAFKIPSEEVAAMLVEQMERVRAEPSTAEGRRWSKENGKAH